MGVYIKAWHRFNRGQKGGLMPPLPLPVRHQISTPVPSSLSSKRNGHVIYSFPTPSDELKLLISIFGLSASSFPGTPRAPNKQSTIQIYKMKRHEKQLRKLNYSKSNLTGFGEAVIRLIFHQCNSSDAKSN